MNDISVSFLDRCPFDAADPAARKLLRTLGEAYPMSRDAQRLLASVGIPPQNIDFGHPMTDVWLSICQQAADRNLLRKLVVCAADDPRASAYTVFQSLAEIPYVPPTYTSPEESSSSGYQSATLGTAVVTAIILAIGGAATWSRIPYAAGFWLYLVSFLLFFGCALYVIATVRGRAASLGEEDLFERLLELRRAVTDQWVGEEKIRKVQEPRPLNVSWRGVPELMEWSDQPDIAGDLRLDGELATIADSYDAVPGGRLILLGAPGSGKTILAMRLLLDLIDEDRWQRGKPIPVLFSAASWDIENMPNFDDWLEHQLERNYPGLNQAAGRKLGIARAFLDRRDILPVIDGFDEMPATARQKFVAILNDDVRRPFVLTSRIDEFREYFGDEYLRCAGVVQLEPLEFDDVTDYLPTISTADSTAWNEFASRVDDDASVASSIRQAFATPLMVYLARTLYTDAGERVPMELLEHDRFPSSNSICGYLFDGFLDTTYRNSPYRVDDARKWLTFLARNLDNGLDIAWWKLADVVPRHWRAGVLGALGGVLGMVFSLALILAGFGSPTFLAVSVIVGVVVGTAIGLFPGMPPLRVSWKVPVTWKESITSPMWVTICVSFSWPFVQHYHNWWPLLPGAALGGIAPGLVVSYLRRDSPKPEPKSVWAEVRDSSAACTAGGLVVVAVGTLTTSPRGSLTSWILIALAFAFFMSISYIPAAPTSIEKANSMVPMIRDNRVYNLFFIVSVSIAYSVMLSFVIGNMAGIVGGVAVGLIFGTATNMWGRWFIFCRCFLPITGSLPWRIVGFLTDAHQRGVLRQVGPAYQFRHDLLRKRIVGEISGGHE
ncbi:effector-associated domain EAD1-containing protein [Nocardia sp. NPDC050175]|uniref:effector-associated domain EAD1-containing protein n=1 Tax=Nocardia sp. NPDC050175 TaxID=3364317 RepID=UPI00379F50FD